MKPKLLLGLALVLSCGLFGCSTVKTNRSVEAWQASLPWIAFNGKYLLARNQLWDVASGKKIRQFAVPPQMTISNGVLHGYGSVEVVAFSPDGKQVLIVTARLIGPEMLAPGPVQLWDIASGHKLLEFTPDERIDNARFLPDGKRILTTSGGQKHPIQIWDTKTGQRLLALNECPVSFLSGQIPSFSPDGRLLATEGSAGTTGHYYRIVNVRNSFTGQRVCTITDTTNSFFGMALFSPDGKSILTAESFYSRDIPSLTDRPGETTLWDAQTGRRIRDFGQINPRLFTPDGRKLICTGKKCAIILCDAKTGGEIRQMLLPGTGGEWVIDKIALSHDGTRLVAQYTTSGEMAAALWNMDTGELIKQFGSEPAMYWETVVGFAPEGETFMTINKNRKPELFNGNTGQPVKVLEDFQQP
jgi:WD40 repeat protein